MICCSTFPKGVFTAVFKSQVAIPKVLIAEATIDARTGELRTVYYDNNAQRQIVDETAGTIEYDTGIIKINNIYFCRIIWYYVLYTK